MLRVEGEWTAATLLLRTIAFQNVISLYVLLFALIWIYAVLLWSYIVSYYLKWLWCRIFQDTYFPRHCAFRYENFWGSHLKIFTWLQQHITITYSATGVSLDLIYSFLHHHHNHDHHYFQPWLQYSVVCHPCKGWQTLPKF